jgi:hypothetical protein
MPHVTVRTEAMAAAACCMQKPLILSRVPNLDTVVAVHDVLAARRLASEALVAVSDRLLCGSGRVGDRTWSRDALGPEEGRGKGNREAAEQEVKYAKAVRDLGVLLTRMHSVASSVAVRSLRRSASALESRRSH